jgi:hypothetical protein
MLELFNQNGLLYDIEIYKNFFCCTFYSLDAKQYRTYVWFEDRDDRAALKQLVLGRKNGEQRRLISFNGWNFDDPVLIHLFNNPNITKLELWEFAQTLIRGEHNPYRYNLPFVSYDTLEIVRAGFNTTSLKMAAITLKFPRIQDLPIPFDQLITKDNVQDIIDYNKNDVDILDYVIKYLVSQLEMRELLSNSYQTNLHSISNSGIGKEIVFNAYINKLKASGYSVVINAVKYGRTVRKSIAFTDVIFPQIQFKTSQLQQLLEQLKQIKLTLDDNELGELDEQEL